METITAHNLPRSLHRTETPRNVIQFISSAKSTYYTAKITEAASDHKQLYNVVNALLIKPEASLPDGGSLEQLASRFSAFFQDKKNQTDSGELDTQGRPHLRASR